jgi:hypothetical protein
MPDFHKSYKKSKNSKNSKSGGRRRKHTMRKYRRGKKVMRGGAYINSSDGLNIKLKTRTDIKNKLIIAFGLTENATTQEIFDAVEKHYGSKGDYINTSEVTQRDGPIRNDPDLVTFFSSFI